MHIPLRRGRVFTPQDDVRSAPVTIINETAAQKFFPGVDPIGRHVASSGDRIMREIVGIVSDVRFDGPARSGQQELYLPYRQVPWQAMSIVVDSALSADQVVAAMRAEVKRLDPDQAVAATKPMTAVVAASMTQQRFTSSLLGAFAVLALSLAGIGLYGVITLFVTQRRHEFGIRMALGAQPGDVVRMVMGQGLRVIGAGVGVGIVGALAAARLLSGLLFGISAMNPAIVPARGGDDGGNRCGGVLHPGAASGERRSTSRAAVGIALLLSDRGADQRLGDAGANLLDDAPDAGNDDVGAIDHDVMRAVARDDSAAVR